MTTEDVNPAAESQVAPRTLNELILLDTYQGMSDDEIEMIMEYRIQNALKGAELEMLKEQNETMAKTTRDLYQKMHDECMKSQEAFRASIKERERITIKPHSGTDIPIPNIGGDSVG